MFCLLLEWRFLISMAILQKTQGSFLKNSTSMWCTYISSMAMTCRTSFPNTFEMRRISVVQPHCPQVAFISRFVTPSSMDPTIIAECYSCDQNMLLPTQQLENFRSAISENGKSLYKPDRNLLNTLINGLQSQLAFLAYRMLDFSR